MEDEKYYLEICESLDEDEILSILESNFVNKELRHFFKHQMIMGVLKQTAYAVAAVGMLSAITSIVHKTLNNNEDDGS